MWMLRFAQFDSKTGASELVKKHGLYIGIVHYLDLRVLCCLLCAHGRDDQEAEAGSGLQRQSRSP